MPDVTITIDAECGRSLNSEATRDRYGGFDLEVDPCSNCIETAHQHGKDEAEDND